MKQGEEEQVQLNKDTSEVRDYGRIAERFVRFVRFAGLLDLSDLSDLSNSAIKKNARRTNKLTEEQTDRQTNGQTDPLIEMHGRV